MYPIKEHSITQTYKSFHAITLKDVWENAFFVLMDKLLRCAMMEIKLIFFRQKSQKKNARNLVIFGT